MDINQFNQYLNTGVDNAIQSFKNCMSKYADFKGRATRGEYWWFFLDVFIITELVQALFEHIPLGGLSVQSTVMFASLMGNVVFLLPSTAAGCRRLHDVGRSGWWWLLCLTGIGAFVVLYWFCKASDPQANQFGEPTPLMPSEGKQKK